MGDYPKFYTRRNVRAIKQYKCCECGKAICKDEVYAYTFGVWDEPQSFRQCLNCRDISAYAYAEDEKNGGDGIVIGELREWFLSHVSYGFNGEVLLRHFADKIGISTADLNLLLKIEGKEK